jgi:hypothetical protein
MGTHVQHTGGFAWPQISVPFTAHLCALVPPRRAARSRSRLLQLGFIPRTTDSRSRSASCQNQITRRKHPGAFPSIPPVGFLPLPPHLLEAWGVSEAGPARPVRSKRSKESVGGKDKKKRKQNGQASRQADNALFTSVLASCFPMRPFLSPALRVGGWYVTSLIIQPPRHPPPPPPPP